MYSKLYTLTTIKVVEWSTHDSVFQYTAFISDEKKDTDMSIEEPSPEEIEQSQERAREKRESEPIMRLASRPQAVHTMLCLLDQGGLDVGGSTIQEQADITRKTWYEVRDLLLDLNLIEQTRKEGNVRLYRAKMESDQVDSLIRLRDTLIQAE